MRKYLYLKFLSGYLLFGLLGFSFIALCSSSMTHTYLLHQNAKTLYDEAVMIADSYEKNASFQTDIQTAGAKEQLELAARFVRASIWIADSDGRIILDSDSGKKNDAGIPGFDPAESDGLSAGQNRQTRIGKNYTIGRYYGMFSEDMLTVSAPMTYRYATIGYIIIHQPMSYIMQSTNQILSIVYLSGGILFALSLILLIIFGFTVYRPLKAVTRGAKEFAGGNLSYRIVLRQDDEMGYLAKTLNYMADELDKTEEYQKRFIANVSHDFRSPLTSIRGFLEAILDGTVPPEMTEKYLHRVIGETNRLHKLTEGMLTLNSLDAKGRMLNRSSFDINRTIRDVCASNETICMQKHIRFELTFAEEIEMVYADYDKIQQVLYNLVDNAIKFSDPGSAIFISTVIRQRKIFVSVKDTGCGIPKASVKKIWERFYKSDASRGRDKSGTGLGLSIVREIIQAHGETIDVISTEKIGSEFIFSLPMAEPHELSQG